jgi:complex III assembly factor LYRM7
MTTQALSARGAYRSLLRATRVAFQSQSSAPPSHEASRGRTLTIVSPDDARVLSAARQEARQNFDSHRREGVDTPMQIRHAMEVAEILRHNLVQGARDEANEAGRWGMYRSFASC